jgi:crotonobetainyl-CoA:carnitine CoA-transferase CaiB-like acyl-CoA transferase
MTQQPLGSRPPLSPQRPLNGLRVLDLSRALSGPFAGRILADLGADVVKVELPDSLAGLHGTIAILAALRLRDRTGTGQHIDVSMLDAMLATDEPRPVVRMPYRFSNAGSGPVRGVPETGEHTKDVLAEWAGHAD